jgi:hypothetical protein
MLVRPKPSVVDLKHAVDNFALKWAKFYVLAGEVAAVMFAKRFDKFGHIGTQCARTVTVKPR